MHYTSYFVLNAFFYFLLKRISFSDTQSDVNIKRSLADTCYLGPGFFMSQKSRKSQKPRESQKVWTLKVPKNTVAIYELLCFPGLSVFSVLQCFLPSFARFPSQESLPKSPNILQVFSFQLSRLFGSLVFYADVSFLYVRRATKGGRKISIQNSLWAAVGVRLFCLA